MSLDDLKRQAALKAVEFIHSGMVVGLGTGSTAVHATRAIGEMLADGRLRDILAIPTSHTTAKQAQQLGIPLTTLDSHPQIDITIDGADEVDPQLNLIKGLGGALLHEKIVATASQRLIIVVDERKRVSQLGSQTPVPVEVIRFALETVRTYLQSLATKVTLRQQDNLPFITDENNIILDCHFDTIDDPEQLAQAIRQQPGVVEHGLFLNLATEAIIASSQGVQVIHK